MNKLSQFCSCDNFKCPLHPTNHDKGCAPCIKKNLKLGEIPNCFFQKVEMLEVEILLKILPNWYWV
mgnify:CR=1 FL=1